MSSKADRFLEQHPELLHADETSESAIRKLASAVAPLEWYHRFQIHGMERIPASGGFLFVINHSVGVISELFLLLRTWHIHFRGTRPPVRALSHQLWWQFPATLMQFPKIGAIFAHPDVARRRLANGDVILLYPGGDLEAFRPFSDRYKVTLGGRHRFVTLAREAGVPIVPLVVCGSHANYVVLPGAQTLAQKTPLGRMYRAKSLPLSLGLAGVSVTALASLAMPLLLPLLGLASLQAMIPAPSRIEAEILAPILPREDESDQECARRIRDAMQVSMDQMAGNRTTPWG